MKRLLLLTLFGLILLTGTISSSSYIFEKEDVVNFPFVCLTENNSYCNSATVCTITTTDPTGLKVLDNSSLSFNETFFNATLNTSKIGTYSNIIICSSSNSTSSEFTYLITNTGGDFSTSQGIMLFGVIIVILFIALVFFIVSIVTRFVPAKLFLMGLGIVFTIFALGISVSFLRVLFELFESTGNAYSQMYFLATVISFGGFLGLVLYLIYRAVNSFRISRGLKDEDD